ncbi:MAG TPA: tetratricopeptide repeat protein, partial [Gemmatimonadaceae bacterium]|nr:tetratricopeptide repeat protein [Gemmatimonadaceae bacterium]
MSNVAKLKKKAAELEQKKQFDKALQVYIQIVEQIEGQEEEGDVALYNRVGDLMLRQQNVGQAVEYYERAVDLYAEGGFFNNAIALCNKILRNSPGRSSIYYKLGKISAKKGFTSDAKQNFLEYADRMQRAGNLDEAFRALKEFADLCPDQDDIRLMLAEQLTKRERKAEALDQLQTLYEKFESEGRSAEARATVDRMKAIDPSTQPKASGTQRPQKSSDLVFLDVDYGDAKARPGAAPSRGAPARGGDVPPKSSPLADLPMLDTGEATQPTAGAPAPMMDPGRASVDASLDPGGSSLLGLEPTTLGGGANAGPGGLLDLEPTSLSSGD